MMTVDDAKELIKDLARDHINDHDGGYKFAADLLRSLNSLDPSSKEIFRETLLGLVSQVQPTLWGVALEALTRESAPETAVILERLLRSQQGTIEWTRQIILALLRIGKSSDVYVPFITEHLRDPDLVLLAHLATTDPESCLRIASQYFARYVSSEPDRTWIQNSMGAFISAFAHNPDLLPELIDRTSSIKPSAGREVKQLILEYLRNPWVEQTYGPHVVDALQSSLISASDSGESSS